VRIIADYISRVPFLELQAAFKDAILATEYLRSNTTDLMFLDIHLPKLKGMAFLKTLVDPPAVIITSAYHQYALEGYELSVTDYLLKPIEFERFLAAVNKVRKAQTERRAEEKNFIFLTVQKKKVKISFHDIIYIESQREYIKVVTTKKEYMSKISTQEIESMLPADQFRRVHRSFIISVSKIDSYTSEFVEVSGIPIPVGRGYRDVIENL
jgi:DNA-binding LytR/AlgR family response regulator